MRELFNQFNDIQVLEPPLRQYILKMLEPVKKRKMEYLLTEGETSRYIYFLEKGLLRSFRYHKKKEETLWIMPENNFIVAVESFFTGGPSTEFIQALEYSILRRIDYDQLQHAYTHHPQFNLHGRKILEQYYIQSLQRESMRRKRAIEKYKYLMENQPDLVGRVQDQYLASYLGITAETFSEQKRKYANTPKRHAGGRK
jgi:CRP-like cAMP-binding protein